MFRKLLLFIISLVSVSTASAASFVSREGAPKGVMSERVIAVAPSHGRYFEPKLDRWEWQRGRLNTTVEDLFSASFVNPFLIPMLENAGAYVVTPRERDTSTMELIIDGDGALAVGDYEEHQGRKTDKKHRWTDSPRQGFAHTEAALPDGYNPFKAGKARQAKATTDADRAVKATWSASVPDDGNFAVYVGYQSSPQSCPEVTYTIHTAAGAETVTVDQRKGGGTWVYLGTFPFQASKSSEPLVEVTSLSNAEGTVSADAVKIGGGMGNVARSGLTSSMPRYAEAARYWLQWAGMPDSIYASTGEGDYRDDIYARPMWANYLKRDLGIPVDLFLSFHTDAGLTESPSETVGTMGICYTQKGRKKFNRVLADSVLSKLMRDVRYLHDPQWNQRKTLDKSYIEIRIPEMPSMLVELLSHQNYADMAHGLDPQFKFDVSRALYKGILSYLASVKKARYVVQPLPVNSFAVARREKASSPAQLTLSWEPTPDPLEPTAFPSRYRVEERIGDASQPFRLLEVTTSTHLNVEIVPGQIHSYRIVAENDGGRSFPSEVLAAGYSVRSATNWITVVNGFTRVSAPDRFWSGNYAGFGMRDAGVVWGDDPYSTGRVHEFDRLKPWTDDDNPGFGASGWEFEGKTLRGNNFDLTIIHGEAILGSGRSFVSSSVAAFCADTLSAPPIVDLMLGLQRMANNPDHAAFPYALQRRLSTLAQEGTKLIVSGAYVGSEVVTDAERTWAASVLGFSPRGIAYGPPAGVAEVNSRFFAAFPGSHFSLACGPDDSPYRISTTDAITNAAGAPSAVVMRYDVSAMPAAVALTRPTHSAVTLGFPFESVIGTESRKLLMTQILKSLSL